MEITILMPCLNEAETIASCTIEAVNALRTAGINGEVLIADNGSTDGSQIIAIKNGARIVEIKEKGYGNAIRGGIQSAKGKYILMGDADGSYDFNSVCSFLRKHSEGYTIVMGNRFKGSIMKGAMPWKNRYIGNPVLSAIGRVLFNCPAGDFHCGIRSFEKEAIEKLNLKTSGMEFASEMIIKATVFKLKIGEIPAILRPDGRSRPPHLRPWRDGWRHLRFMLLYSPRWLFLIPGLAIFLVSAITWLVLSTRPVKIGAIILGMNTMIFSAIFTLIGFQLIIHAISTKVFAVQSGLCPPNLLYTKLFKLINLEKGIFVGTLISIVGLFLSVKSLIIWESYNFGLLPNESLIHLVISGGALLALGIQIIFTSFFLSTLGLKIDNKL